MTQFPDPSPDSQTTASQRDQHSVEPAHEPTPFNAQTISAERVSPGFLLELTAADLHQLLHRALEPSENKMLLNSLIDNVRALCEDSEPAIQPFHETLVTVLAEEIDRARGDNPLAECKRLQMLFTLSEVIINAFTNNPSVLKPNALNKLALSFIEVVTELDEDRMAFDELEEEFAIDYYDLVEQWEGLYLVPYSHLMVLLDVPGFKPSDETMEACRSLLNMQLEWQRQNQGPGSATNGAVAEVWVATMNFAAMIGDDRFHEEIAAVVTEVTEIIDSWNDGEVTVIASQLEHPRDVEESEKIMAAHDRCQMMALRALLQCQYGCAAEPVWKQVLEESTLGSDAARIAFLGLAEADMNEVAPYLVKLLNEMGNPRCKGNSLSRRMNTLELLLSKPGAVGLFESAFDRSGSHDTGESEKHTVDPLRQARIVEVMRQRLALHDKNFQKATSAIKKCETDLERELLTVKYSNRGVIWSKPVVYALRGVVD